MAKRFFYVCLGLLLLALAYNLGAERAGAENAGDPFPIGNIVVASSNMVLTADGRVWECPQYPPYTWNEVSQKAPPIPASEVAFINDWMLISRSGDVWVSPERFSPWVQAASPPGGGVGVDETTWGQLKSKYRN